MSTKNIIDIANVHEKLRKIFNTTNKKGVLQGSRYIRKGLSGKRVIFFPSAKNQSLMPCESRLEKDNCLFMELDKEVVNYRTQPFSIRLNNKQSYTPDSVHIDINENITVREVKFSGSLESCSLIEKLAKIKRLFSSEDINFEILTEKELQKNPDCYNRKLIYRSSHQSYHSFQIKEALELVPENDGNYKLNIFRKDCSKIGLCPLIAEWLMSKGMIQYDDSKLLSEDSRIWKLGEEL